MPLLKSTPTPNEGCNAAKVTRAAAELQDAATLRDEEFEIAQVFRMKKKRSFSANMPAEEPSRLQSADFILPLRNCNARAENLIHARFGRQWPFRNKTWATSA